MSADSLSVAAMPKGTSDTHAAGGGATKHGDDRAVGPLLAEVTSWCDPIAREIARRNHALDGRQIHRALERFVERALEGEEDT